MYLYKNVNGCMCTYTSIIEFFVLIEIYCQ